MDLSKAFDHFVYFKPINKNIWLWF
jgi:hypothetical protein